VGDAFQGEVAAGIEEGMGQAEPARRARRCGTVSIHGVKPTRDGGNVALR